MAVFLYILLLALAVNLAKRAVKYSMLLLLNVFDLRSPITPRASDAKLRILLEGPGTRSAVAFITCHNRLLEGDGIDFPYSLVNALINSPN